MHNRSYRNRFSVRLLTSTLLLLLVIAGLVLAASSPVEAAAQTPQKSPWTEPVNLSNSGGVTFPNMVVDPSGVVNTIWLEGDLGYNFSQLVDGQWSPPALVKFPFGSFPPLLIAGEEFIYAFWINKDAGNLLSYSRVAPAKFGDPKGWEPVQKLSKNVAGMNATYQPGGRLHLAYIHTLAETDVPEGLLYMRSVDKGSKWSAPQAVYSSKYFRSMKPDQVNLQLAATAKGDQETVSMVWDNPAIKRVYYARSKDGGVTWEQPAEVDGPAVETEVASPFKIRLAASGDQSMRVWQGNLQSGIYCTQYYEYSKDGGSTWSDRAAMLKNVRGCAAQNDLMVMADGNFLLQSIFPDEAYFSAYNGVLWSEPQLESMLSSFENPATSELIKFSCQKPLLVKTRLYEIGCDDGGPGDAWTMWQEIADVSPWFPKPSAWGIPLQVTSAEDPIYSAHGAADNAGHVHILWTQRVPVPESSRGAPEPEKRSIYYAAWDGEKLTDPAQVLQSPDGFAGEFALAYDVSRDRLDVAWEAGKKGSIYFSWADASSASSSLEWSAPISLPVADSLARTPDVIVRADGTIYIAYSIPINEYRGIYLVKSSDGGVTWSQPVKVYNAAGAAQMVAAPRLALSGSQDVHLFWAQNSVLAEPGPVGLYYSRSSDDGQSWSAANPSVNDPVSEWWILDAGDFGLQRFWNRKIIEGLNLYQDISLDEGSTWSLPASLTGLGELPRSVSMNYDAQAGLGLAQIIQDSADELLLRTQMWDGKDWQLADNLKLDEIAADPLHSLNSEWLPDGRQVVFYAVQQVNHPDGKQPWEIMLRERAPKQAGSPGGNAPSATPLASTTPAAGTPPPTAAQSTSGSPAGTAAVEATPVSETAPAVTEASVGSPTLAAGEVSAATAVQSTETPQPTPLPNLSQDAPALPNNNFGLFLAAALSVAVVAVSFVVTRLRRMR